MDKNFSSLIGSRLSEERERLTFTQAQAGNACGVSREMWGRYERGAAAMGTDVLAAFAAVGADALYVLTGVRNLGDLNPEESALLDNYRHTPPEKQAAVREVSAALAQSGAVPRSKTGNGEQ
jgi:transcriptional regulator with XRE-family HTH domain